MIVLGRNERSMCISFACVSESFVVVAVGMSITWKSCESGVWREARASSSAV